MNYFNMIVQMGFLMIAPFTHITLMPANHSLLFWWLYFLSDDYPAVMTHHFSCSGKERMASCAFVFLFSLLPVSDMQYR